MVLHFEACLRSCVDESGLLRNEGLLRQLRTRLAELHTGRFAKPLGHIIAISGLDQTFFDLRFQS